MSMKAKSVINISVSFLSNIGLNITEHAESITDSGKHCNALPSPFCDDATYD